MDPVDALFARAKAEGIPMSAICDVAGVAQSTPSRWKNDRNSATLATIHSLNEALERLIAEKKEAA